MLKRIASSAGDGRVLLYDLLRDSEHPVKVLDVCGASAPVHDLAFNVKAPELFATTDRQSVKVTLEVDLLQFSNFELELLWYTKMPYADPSACMLSAAVQICKATAACCSWSLFTRNLLSAAIACGFNTISLSHWCICYTAACLVEHHAA